MSNRSLDDLNPGDVFKSYGRTVTETDIVNFTCLAGLKLRVLPHLLQSLANLPPPIARALKRKIAP